MPGHLWGQAQRLVPKKQEKRNEGLEEEKAYISSRLKSKTSSENIEQKLLLKEPISIARLDISINFHRDGLANVSMFESTHALTKNLCTHECMRDCFTHIC